MCEQCGRDPINKTQAMPPSIYLLLWQIGSRGMPDEATMALIGLNEEQILELMRNFDLEFTELKRMHQLTGLIDLETMGNLLRSKLLSQIVQANSGAEVAQLSRAARSLPLWAMPDGIQVEAASMRSAEGMSGSQILSEIELMNGTLEAELERIRRQRREQQQGGL